MPLRPLVTPKEMDEVELEDQTRDPSIPMGSVSRAATKIRRIGKRLQRKYRKELSLPINISLLMGMEMRIWIRMLRHIVSVMDQVMAR
jgi:hypothetical protein